MIPSDDSVAQSRQFAMHGWVRIPGAFSATEAAAMFGDVAPRCGGMLILSGSHRLVHRWFLDHPPRRDA